MGSGRNAHSDRQLVVAFSYADFGLAFIYARQSGLHAQAAFRRLCIKISLRSRAVGTHGQPSRHPHSNIVPFV